MSLSGTKGKKIKSAVPFNLCSGAAGDIYVHPTNCAWKQMNESTYDYFCGQKYFWFKLTLLRKYTGNLLRITSNAIQITLDICTQKTNHNQELSFSSTCLVAVSQAGRLSAPTWFSLD